MEELEPEVIEELKKKAIERDSGSIEIVEEQTSPINAAGTPAEKIEEKPKKSKKVRSEKQIAAFEKAKQKRAENLRLKREQKEKEKLNKKEEKKIIKEKVEEELKKPKEEKLIRQATTAPVAIQQPTMNSSHPREQVIQNHYYYYGVPPPNHYEKPQKKKSRKKQPVIEPSSSSEEEEEEYSNSPIQHPYRPPSPPVEPESYKELQNYQEVPASIPQKSHPKLKFAFA